MTILGRQIDGVAGIIALSLATCLCILLLVFVKSESTAAASVRKVDANSLEKKTGSTSVHASERKACHLPATILSEHKPMRSLVPVKLRDEIVSASTRFNISDINHRAKAGEAVATILVLRAISMCSPAGRHLARTEFDEVITPELTTAVCSTIPRSMTNDPLAYLENSARVGSPEARYLYAVNAPVFAKITQYVDKTSGFARSSRMLKLAEEFGAQAAHDGIQEAYEYMASAYAAGTFGEGKNGLAYSYTLALEDSASSLELRARLEYLKEIITETDEVKARSFAFGCRSTESQGSILASPF